MAVAALLGGGRWPDLVQFLTVRAPTVSHAEQLGPLAVGSEAAAAAEKVVSVARP